MAETTFKRENPAKPEMAAGRPMVYWQGLLTDTKLAPVKKPDPKPKVERLPEDQLRGVLSSLKEEVLTEERGAYMDQSAVNRNHGVIDEVATWLDELGDLHPEDAKEIICAAFESKSGKLREKARTSISLLPLAEQMSAFELVLTRTPESRFICGLFDSIISKCSEADLIRLMKTALKSESSALRREALRLIPSLPAEEHVSAIEIVLAKASDTPGARAAFDSVFRACPEAEKARLIKAGLKSDDKIISSDSLGLAYGRADEAELLMAVLEPASESQSHGYHYRNPSQSGEPDFDKDMRAAERACALPEDGKLLEKASKVLARKYSEMPQNRPEILLMIPKLPAAYRADIIEAALLPGGELTDSIPLIQGVLPAERRDALWQKAEESVAKKLALSDLDEKLAGTLPLFPSKYRANIINRALGPDPRKEIRSGRTNGFVACLKTWELIPGLDPEHQEMSWGFAQSAIINAIKLWAYQNVREEAVRLAVRLPPERSQGVFCRIANSTYPDVHQEMDRLMDSMPAENQVAYLMQAFESYKSGTRRKAFGRISALPEERQIELLECALESSYEDVRMMALRWKREIPDKTRQALVPSLIHDTDERIRIEAALSSSAGNGEMKKTVLSALHSEDPLIHLTALGLSRELFSPEEQKEISRWSAFRKTKSALDSGQYDVAMKAADAIAAFDERRKYKLVKTALWSKHLGVRQKAIEHVIDFGEPKKQIKLAKTALYTSYGDNITKIAFEFLAESEAIKCDWRATELHKLANERLMDVLRFANFKGDKAEMDKINYTGLVCYMDDRVMAHVMEWPFPPTYLPAFAECAARSGPKGCLAIVKKKASFGYIRAYVLTNALNHERYWADAVEMIPSFPVSAEYHETRESLWAAAAVNAEKALCSGIKPRKAAMLLKTFPKEHWPALVELRNKALPGPIGFSIAALAVQLPVSAGKDALPWAAPLIASGLDSSDPGVCDEAVLCYLGIPEAYASGSALATAIGKFKAMLLSEENTVSIRASERIGAFPEERQPELIRTVMESSWWYTVLNGMSLLQKLPPGLQGEKSWELAIYHASTAHFCSVESIRARAIDIAAVFPERRFADVLVRTTPFPDKTHLEDLIRKRMEKANGVIPPEAISCIAELPEGRRTEIYGAAVKSIASRLGSNDPAISKNASELLGNFPPEHQPELVDAAMSSDQGFAAQVAIELLMKLPPELQAEKSWQAAQKHAKAALTGKPTSIGIPAKTMLETVRGFPKPRQEGVLRDIFEGNPENLPPDLLRLGLQCDDKQVALDAVISACNLVEKHMATHPLLKGGRKVFLPGNDPMFLLADAQIVVLDALGSDDYPAVAKASKCILSFPLQFHAGMINSLMSSGFWGPILDGISMLQNLPVPRQSEELWVKAQSWMISAFSLDSDHLRQRAVRLLPGFPKPHLRLLIVLAELSEFDDVRNNLEKARMMENR